MPIRKRSESWFFRWSRPAIVVLSLLGASLTTYLTVTHFVGAKAALCQAEGSGCDLVLSSEYAKVFGIPLTVFGALAYLTVAGLAAMPWLAKEPKQKDRWREQTGWLLFLVTTAMFAFSGYLMYLLAFVIRTADGQATLCIYCLTSAITATALWLSTLLGHDWKDRGQLAFTGTIVVAIVLVGTLGVYSTQNKLAAQSQTFAGRLAIHLRQTNAKMYGAFWCPHCRDQKAMFGEAAAQMPYIECDPRGEKAQPQLCRDKGVRAFPTWEIGGKTYEGVRPLDELARLSGYQELRRDAPPAP